MSNNEVSKRAADLDRSFIGIPSSQDVQDAMTKTVIAPAQEQIARTGGLCVANTVDLNIGEKKPAYLYPTDEETVAGDISLIEKRPSFIDDNVVEERAKAILREAGLLDNNQDN